MRRDEFMNWRSKFVTSKADVIGLRHLPFSFTEQGVTMLSCILKSKEAIEGNIRIVRIFTRLREMLSTHKDILLKLDQLEKQGIQNSEEIQAIFRVLKHLINVPAEPRKRIGFTIPGKNDM
ncbi:MAG: ORF6N domain-containing protein [Bacteroidetes bacterium]|nr:ORF6N domain-containing protein [Bacteroidota bacterium]